MRPLAEPVDRGTVYKSWVHPNTVPENSEYKPEEGVLPSSRLMGMYHWMKSHFHDWIDYVGKFFGIFGVKNLVSGGLKMGRFACK